MNNKNVFILAFITALSFSLPLQAEPSGYYRWKDAEGNLKLSDRPPGGDIKSEFITTPGSKKSRSSGGETTIQSRDTKKADEAKPDFPKEMEVLPEKDPEICQQAQGNLKALSGKTRIRIVDADGNKRFITDEERQTQLSRAKESVDIHCK